VTRKDSRFKTNLSRALDVLSTELRMAGARKGSRVLEMDLSQTKIRNDGFPRSDASPATPHVAVRFTTHRGDVYMDAGSFWSWVDNLYAIARSLEALRAVDRWGAAQGRQYLGFLPPGSGERFGVKPAFTLEQAGTALAALAYPGGGDTFLTKAAYNIMNVADDYARAKRLAAKIAHPDANGSAEDWERYQEATRVLEARHHAG
jgi:hypothetical protein